MESAFCQQAEPDQQMAELSMARVDSYEKMYVVRQSYMPVPSLRSPLPTNTWMYNFLRSTSIILFPLSQSLGKSTTRFGYQARWKSSLAVAVSAM